MAWPRDHIITACIKSLITITRRFPYFYDFLNSLYFAMEVVSILEGREFEEVEDLSYFSVLLSIKKEPFKDIKPENIIFLGMITISNWGHKFNLCFQKNWIRQCS